MKVLFLELAEQELYDSISYYEEQQINLGSRLKNEIYSALIRIQRFPSMFVETKKDIRKCVINKFPFNILYSIEENQIIVIAIAHHHRKPDYWVGRIESN
jgi:plasmid stabilization system protein ParE